MFSNVINKILSEGELYKNELSISESFIEGKNFGKRIRSILFYMYAKKPTEMHHKTIAIIESIHNASLMHDDVIDNNPIRREKESYYKKVGAKESILHGDHLLIKSFKKLLKIHKNSYITHTFLRECEAVAFGAIKEQIINKKQSIVKIPEYLYMASLKTGSLFKLSCFLGSFLTENNFEKAKKAAIFGLCFGIIFQIQNDLDSYIKHINFENSEDYTQKNITFPIILMNYNLNFFKNTTNQKEYNFIRNYILSTAFRSQAFEVSKKYLNKLTIDITTLSY